VPLEQLAEAGLFSRLWSTAIRIIHSSSRWIHARLAGLVAPTGRASPLDEAADNPVTRLLSGGRWRILNLRPLRVRDYSCNGLSVPGSPVIQAHPPVGRRPDTDHPSSRDWSTAVLGTRERAVAGLQGRLPWSFEKRAPHWTSPTRFAVRATASLPWIPCSG
jgi:hypothetical protein